MHNKIAGRYRKLQLDVGLCGALACTITLWASAFVGIRAGLQGYGPAHLAALRFIVAALVLALYAVWRGVRRPAKGDLLAIAASGLVGITLYNLALNAGERTITAGAASMLVNTAPLWTALWALLFLGERLGRGGWIGMGFGWFGAVLIGVSQHGELGVSIGALLVLGAACAQSIYFVLQKPLLVRYRPDELTCYAVWIGTLGLLPFAWSLPAAIMAAPLPATLAAIYLGIAPGAIAYATWAIVLTRMEATRAASTLYLVPAVALLLGWAYLGEVPSILALIGGIVAIGGVILTRHKG